MNSRKFRRSKQVAERKQALKAQKKEWQQYAATEREEGREPLEFSDWLDAQTKTW